MRQIFYRIKQLVVGVFAHKKGSVVVRILRVIKFKAVVFKIIAGQNSQHDNIVLELFDHVFVLQPFLNSAESARSTKIEYFFSRRCFQKIGKPVFRFVTPAFDKGITQHHHTLLFRILGALLVAHAIGIGSIVLRKTGLFMHVRRRRMMPDTEVLVAERPKLAVDVYKAVRGHLDVGIYIFYIKIRCQLKHGYKYKHESQ